VVKKDRDYIPERGDASWIPKQDMSRREDGPLLFCLPRHITAK